ncbi:hypothetical protein C8D88_116113 [Lentzea atacamensis]|uniref:Uncharacterized protein n=1 Tax=Lentzea atacamensis TaxID=531938 RepID=A0A316HTU6_9PSEU|nr:hypothetical protein [Lentzea atacamensis]PWK81702.1 hypothetical protein C8D88_116113 [Lentzea atacamensis]
MDYRIRAVDGSPFPRSQEDVTSVDAEMNEIRYMGMAVGLLAAEVDELVDVWTDWWGVGPKTHLDFGILSRSVANRATGQAWRPGEMTT